MKNFKLASLVSGVTLLAATLAPVSASALSTATISMDGVHSSNGSFSFVVYEDTGSDTVTGANVVLTFDQPVNGLSYDYSVGPFTAATPSGAHNAYGTVTGRNALARVSFSISSPGTVIADVSGSSYLKHADATSVTNFDLNLGEAYFTYDAPAPKAAATSTGTGAAADTAAPADTPAPLNPEVKAAQTTKKTAVVKTSHTGAAVASTLSIAVVAVVAAAYWMLMRRRTAITAAVKAYRLEGTTPSKNKPAGRKKK